MLEKVINEVHEINEAKVKFWDILKDAKNVKETNSKLTQAPELDIAFTNRGGAKLNFGWNGKGTIYEYKGSKFSAKFATRFKSVKEVEVVYFDFQGDYDGSEYITVNRLFSKLKMKPTEMPYQLVDTAITTVVNVVRSKNGEQLIVQFKNGAEFILHDNWNEDSQRKKMLAIEANIFKLEKMGFKSNKIKAALKILEPEIYNKRKVNKFTSTESLSEYLEMEVTFGFQDTGGITGEGIGFRKEMTKDKVILTTYAGHSFYGEWTKFNIELRVPISKTDVNKRIKKYKEYQDKMSGRLQAYGKGLADYVKATGGHKGNPVWMD